MSEDWNEIIDTGFPGPGFKQIVAYGRGRGRGLLNINKENGVGLKSAVDSVNASQSWDGVQGGFGKKTFQKSNTASTDWAGNPPQAAFGNKVFGSSDGTSDDWNDNRPTEGGFGSKGFGVPNNSTADWSDNKTSHGGFGQKSFGIRNTFSQESAETKPGFGGFRKNADENWGDSNSQQQHTGFDRKIFRSVPNGNAENRSGFGRGETRMSGRTSDRGCFKCGEHGHISRDCPQGGGGSGRGGACYRCGEEGHISRDCPQGGGGSGRSGACYRCGEEGHISRDCPQGGGRQGGRSGPSGTCYNCGEAGHMARDCPNSRSGSARPGQGEKQPENYIPPPPPESEDEIFQSVQQGINFDKYDNIKVFVTGRNAPQTGVSCFSEAGLHDVIAKNVQKARYLKPTPVQKHAIPVIMNDRDLMACAQTGSGKTAAFLLPVLTKMIENGLHGSSFSEIQEPQTMVIGPTRELVVQIYNEARKFAFNTSLRPVVVYGGTSVGHQLQQISKGAHMVVGTPGRLKDFIERGKISLSKVRFLILDEADRMLDMGFEPVVRQIVEQMGMTPKSERQTLMFSATFPEEIQKLASDFLKDHIFITVGRVGGANTDIKQIVYQVEKNEKREKLVSILNETGTSRALVFVEQKRSTDFLAAFLCQFDFPATSIHGDRYQSQREEALADFKSGRKPILVATSVASRGLDIRGVEHVINFDMPKSIDEYVHRIGRTGRCGNLGKATSFFDPQVDNDIAQPLVSILVDAQQEVPEWLADIADRNSCGFVPSGGKYGGRDIRRKQYKDDRNSDFNSRGFNEGTLPNTVVDDEEVWDD